MDTERIRASLNLYAVLQNLEDLVRLDPVTARLSQGWDLSIQFSVHDGPAAYLTFKEGACVHGIGYHDNPSIRLFFRSCSHVNAMFAGQANPIPLKGFTRLGFLKRDFSQLTDRLAHFLQPPDGAHDEAFIRISTTLTMNTALCAARELARQEPVSGKIAAAIPRGILQMEVLPDGPCAHVVFNGDGMTVGKCRADAPSAVMVFRDIATASAMLAGKLDAFLAVADGRVMLRGQLPMIDNLGLILERVEHYIK